MFQKVEKYQYTVEESLLNTFEKRGARATGSALCPKMSADCIWLANLSEREEYKLIEQLGPIT